MKVVLGCLGDFTHIFSNSINLLTNFIFSLRLDNIPLCICTTFSLSSCVYNFALTFIPSAWGVENEQTGFIHLISAPDMGRSADKE